MSRMTDLEQARGAHSAVTRRSSDSKIWSEYRTMAMKLPVLIHNAGLVEAAHFVASRSSRAQRAILEDVARQLGFPDEDAMLASFRELDAVGLRVRQREVSRVVAWYRRVAQSIGKAGSPRAGRG